MKIENRAELQKLREKFLYQIEKQTKKIYVCGGTGCVAGGSLEIFDRLKELIEEKGIVCQVELYEEVEGECTSMKKSGATAFVKWDRC